MNYHIYRKQRVESGVSERECNNVTECQPSDAKIARELEALRAKVQRKYSPAKTFHKHPGKMPGSASCLQNSFEASNGSDRLQQPK
jgi:hypothetical protein